MSRSGVRSLDSPASRTSTRAVALGALAIVAAIALAYANSLSAPFVYDDKPSIVYNGSIRHLWPLHDVLTPPGAGATVSGRPVLNVSFALNYALGGLEVRGYHLANMAIHALAALTLFGLVRRTLQRPSVPASLRQAAFPSALAIAVLWAVHPLQTEAVTYVAQRAESLMSLFYLVTLYAVVRAVESERPRTWRALGWTACLLGMGTKENMVSAPLIVFCFDRAFVAGTFASAWRQRRGFYLALAATWLPLAWLVLSTGGNRGGSAGFGVGVSWFDYALTQVPALARYLALAVWPCPLVFDYGAFFVRDVKEIVLPALIVGLTIGATLYALWRRPQLGFLGAMPFALLAPTSLVPGTTQMIVEHRMYLPLAPVLVALGAIVAALGLRRTAVGAVVLAAMALIGATVARHRAYATEIGLWADTVAKRPDNAVAHSSLGAMLADAGHRDVAMAEDKRALELNPDYGPALANLAVALTELGQPAAALPFAEKAVLRQPNNAQAHINLGIALDLLGRASEALPYYEAAVRLNPLLPAAHNDWGEALSRAGKLDEAIAELRESIRLQPDYRAAHFNLAAALLRSGRLEAAKAEFAIGVKLQPEASAYLSWANLLVRQHHADAAFEAYEAAVKLDPNAPEIRYAYATALAGTQRYDDAIREYAAAIRLRPEYAEAHNNLANTFVAANRVAEAIPEYQAALRIRPNDASTHNNLGLAFARRGRLREAVDEFDAAVRLAPDFADARANLAKARAQLREPFGGP